MLAIAMTRLTNSLNFFSFSAADNSIDCLNKDSKIKMAIDALTDLEQEKDPNDKQKVLLAKKAEIQALSCKQNPCSKSHTKDQEKQAEDFLSECKKAAGWSTTAKIGAGVGGFGAAALTAYLTKKYVFDKQEKNS